MCRFDVHVMDVQASTEDHDMWKVDVHKVSPALSDFPGHVLEPWGYIM